MCVYMCTHTHTHADLLTPDSEARELITPSFRSQKRQTQPVFLRSTADVACLTECVYISVFSGTSQTNRGCAGLHFCTQSAKSVRSHANMWAYFMVGV